MTCKDCYHYEVCFASINEKTSAIKNFKCKCGFFKDKGKIIELPCKPDTEIYGIFENGVGEAEKYFIDKGQIKYFCIEKNLVSFYSRYESLSYWHDLSDFSKTVFLSREDAEKALKEREENGDG